VHLLGDTADSFAFDLSGTRVTNKEAVTYGEPWGVGDALGCFLDLDLYTISYSRNGLWLQIANVIPEEFHGKFFFPHILLKNVKCKVNFGAQPSFTPVPLGYEWMTEASPTNSIEGPKAPSTKAECEVILTIGLGFAGKTTWAKKFAKEHPEKHYYIIGPDHVIEHIKPWLFPKFDSEDKEKKDEKLSQLRARSFSLANSAIGGLLKLVEDSPRNIILDTGRTNTFLSKMRRSNEPSKPLPSNGRRDWRSWNFFAGFGKKNCIYFPSSNCGDQKTC
jgi:heterogeneous nuclear ribonucleoprotein U-like protein 1